MDTVGRPCPGQDNVIGAPAPRPFETNRAELFQPLESRWIDCAGYDVRPLPKTQPRSGKHRAAFDCRLSLRERNEERYFRGAKGDTYFPHDANGTFRYLVGPLSCVLFRIRMGISPMAEKTPTFADYFFLGPLGFT